MTRGSAFFVTTLLLSCSVLAAAAAAPAPAPSDLAAPLDSFTLAESSVELVNPERGYYVSMNLLAPGDAARVRKSGHSLAFAIVRLDAYRGQPLDAELLAALGRGFTSVRAAGIKVILRFSYNAAYQADAPKARILEHIAQLAPLLQQNADVIAVMQAGFIGAWGEWHHSTSGLDNDNDRAEILNAVLQALPVTRAVQVRRPMFKASVFPGGALGPRDAYTGQPRARVGHHNDCFLANRSDLGTYARPVSTWRAYLAADGRFTPVGGETCAVSARSQCTSAITEMTSNHWSFLNQQHSEKVVATWRKDGCGREIASRLGYRFALLRVAHSKTVRPGGVLEVQLDVYNHGFAAPFNPRSAFLVLEAKGKRREVQLGSLDPRRWAPGETSKVDVRVRVPVDLAPGSYQIGLWLPDETVGLRKDPRYSIRLANDGLWDESSGVNRLPGSLRVDAEAPGAIDTTARQLVEVK